MNNNKWCNGASHPVDFAENCCEDCECYLKDRSQKLSIELDQLKIEFLKVFLDKKSWVGVAFWCACGLLIVDMIMQML